MPTNATQPEPTARRGRPKLQEPKAAPVNFRPDAELGSLIEDAVKATGLSRSDVVRLGIERGVPILVKQLTGTAPDLETAAN